MTTESRVISMMDSSSWLLATSTGGVARRDTDRCGRRCGTRCGMRSAWQLVAAAASSSPSRISDAVVGRFEEPTDHSTRI